MSQKEELRKKFKEWYDRSHSQDREQEWHPPNEDSIFGFFYSEIEAREKRLEEMESDMIDIYREKRDLQAKSPT